MASIREETEKIERSVLSKYACFSDSSLGRDRYEEPDPMRPVFQRDRDRIIHCKAFRRLKHKTQVFLAPEGDHYRTRLTHTLEVAQIARSIARALRLNEDLTEAIALGHDLGHTPFGHAGERTLSKISSIRFNHCDHGIRVVEVLEKNGEGLNLTKEVRDGIINHRTSGDPSTLEGQVVRFSDKIAYINHDIDDAIRGEIFRETDIPSEFAEVLGHSSRERLDTLIHSIVDESRDKPSIIMKDSVQTAMMDLRKFMFENLYRNSRAKSEETKVERMIEILYDHFLKNEKEIPAVYMDIIKKRGEDLEYAVCDYIASMSDQYSIKTFEKIYIPLAWKD
ncbi:MAG: deoxyguanosinetriphosphate triphosphohydrolase [Clostridiales bacterium]|nr:deoxyguanosinetriphosphate triphosphohydrolase [Clostridiales bacterium]